MTGPVAVQVIVSPEWHSKLTATAGWAEFASTVGAVTVDDAPYYRLSVRWRHTRQVLAEDSPDSLIETEVTDQQQAIIAVEAAWFLELIESDSLTAEIGRLKALFPQGYSVTLIIEGLEKHFRDKDSQSQREFRDRVQGKRPRSKRKAIPAPSVTRAMAEMGLIDLQLDLNLMLRTSYNATETLELVHLHTKAVATAVDGEGSHGLGFDPSTARNKVNVTAKNGYAGLRDVWVKQLEQFPGVSEHKARAIAEGYPSPLAIVAGFETKGDRALEAVSKLASG